MNAQSNHTITDTTDPQFLGPEAGQQAGGFEELTYDLAATYSPDDNKLRLSSATRPVAQEVAPFGIEFTIAEPGPAKTGFHAGLVIPPALPAYEATPAGVVRRAGETGSFKLIGDAAKMAAAMIASADRHPAPRRLVMGSTSYVAIRAALEQRIVALDAQKDLALSTDGD